MQENTEEKNLIKRDTSTNFFGKIKEFFRKLFTKKEIVYETVTINMEENKKEFANSIKVESEVEADIELLNLQRKIRNGEIKIEDLTEEQEDKLIDLYDKQIAVKKAKIEELKKKIEKVKKAS